MSSTEELKRDRNDSWEDDVNHDDGQHHNDILFNERERGSLSAPVSVLWPKLRILYPFAAVIKDHHRFSVA